jgi:ABC-type spermidine/putrescine transport system permease subunit II
LSPVVLAAPIPIGGAVSSMSTVLSIGFLPLNLLLYTKLCYNADVLQNLDWNSLFASLAIVIGAISVGLLCSYKFHSRHFNKAANAIGNVSGLALIIIVNHMVTTSGIV